MNASAAMLAITLLLTANRAMAQEPAPPGANEAEFAARRHPQPVRVGDLIDRPVLQPLESRPVLGHVVGVVRQNDGTLRIVMRMGGWLGFGGRSIAVPADAMVLLGSELEVLDYTPAQLRRFQTYDGTACTGVGRDEFIRLGLAHPSH